jgi:hypothetical protein
MVKTLKILGVIFLVLMVLIVSAYIWFDKNQGKIAGNLLREKFKTSALSKVYHLDFTSLDLKLLSGKIVIHDFSFKPDSLIYQANDTLRLKYPLLIEAEVPLLSLYDLDVLELLKNKKVIIGGIEITNPGIRLIDHLTKEEKELRSKNYKPEPDTSAKKPNPINHLNLQYFSIVGGSAEVYNRVTARSIFKADSIQLLLSDVLVDPEKPLNTILDKTYGSSKFEVGSVTLKNEKGFYDFELGGVALNLAENSLAINRLKLMPKYTKAQFGRKFGKQTDRFDVNVQSIKIHGFDINRYLLSGGIKLQSVIVEGLNLEIHRDKNVPFDQTKFPKLPWQSLAQVKNYLEIDSIVVNNSSILYEELAEGRPDAGRVPIGNVNISVLNVSNDSVFIAKNGPMTVQMKAKIFNQGDLLLNIEVPEDLTSSDFSFSGRVGPMDMQAFNSITELNVHVNIEKGTLDSLVFWANANETYATGQLTMVYDSLKINVLKKDEEKTKLQEMGVVSWLGNQIVKSFNPAKDKPGDKPLVAEIFVERDKNKSVFNYIVKAFISGIKGSLVPAIGQSLKKYEKKKVKEAKQEEREKKRQGKKEKKQGK